MNYPPLRPSLPQAIGYPEFLKFATDFDLSNSVILSTLEIGDIFLSSIRTVDHGSTIRKLTFPEFWEALVRCALLPALEPPPPPPPMQ